MSTHACQPIKSSQAPKHRIIKVAEEYFYLDFIDKVVEEIQTKAFLVQAGLDSFSEAETFAYWILKREGYFEGSPLSSDEIEEMKSGLVDPIKLTTNVEP